MSLAVTSSQKQTNCLAPCLSSTGAEAAVGPAAVVGLDRVEVGSYRCRIAVAGGPAHALDGLQARQLALKGGGAEVVESGHLASSINRRRQVRRNALVQRGVVARPGARLVEQRAGRLEAPAHRDQVAVELPALGGRPAVFEPDGHSTRHFAAAFRARHHIRGSMGTPWDCKAIAASSPSGTSGLESTSAVMRTPASSRSWAAR